MALLDVRDALHAVAGRATDRVVAGVLGRRSRRLLGPAGRHRRPAAHPRPRPPAHPPLPAGLAAGRGGAARAEPDRSAAARGSRPIAPGVAISFEEVVLDRGAHVAERPAAAAAGRRRGGRARPGARPDDGRSAGRARARRLPDPWPVEARDLFVRLLAAGPGLLGVWETLDETGALERVLPEWERVRLLPHASVVHRFTVDRHLVETCIEASTLIRRVARPDVLMVAALLHDIGKGQLTEHCVAGEPIAREIAARIGLRRARGRAGRRPGPLAPAAARDRDHPRPRRPGHGRARHRQDRPTARSSSCWPP